MPLSVCRDAVDAADLLLLDLKAMDTALCKRVSGKGNEDASAMQEYRESTGAPVWIRHVCVPGLTLDFGELEEMAAYVRAFTVSNWLSCFQFHKWESLNGLDFPGHTNSPTRRNRSGFHG
jgi:pyruvate formate lyase activating enzyme